MVLYIARDRHRHLSEEKKKKAASIGHRVSIGTMHACNGGFALPSGLGVVHKFSPFPRLYKAYAIYTHKNIWNVHFPKALISSPPRENGGFA